MVDDVALNQSAAIERCLIRIREVHSGDDRNLLTDLTRQDSILLNLQRACEASIDLAMHLVRVRGLGLPQESREAFDLLEEAGVITRETAARMRAMVGFRNVAVHTYQDLDLKIVRSIVRERLSDFEEFTSSVLRQAP